MKATTINNLLDLIVGMRGLGGGEIALFKEIAKNLEDSEARLQALEARVQELERGKQ